MIEKIDTIKWNFGQDLGAVAPGGKLLDGREAAIEEIAEKLNEVILYLNIEKIAERAANS